MKCPNCQKKFKNGSRCPNCEVDAVLYMGTVRLSDKLHNKGLERLKNGDLYHGIEDLTKSVSINKNNVPARNLLGLALFEVGHVGEALKHWVISQSMLKEENAATKYIESADKNPRQIERMNDAVEMYNQALGHIKQKSDDLAIIQLKKAVEVNPRFIDALNLLTLCYLIQNERERAIATAERVISMDIYNPIALNYYQILNPGKSKPPKPSKPATVPNKTPYKSIGLEEKKQRNFHFAELLTFLIGVGCTIAAGYFLLIPSLDSSQEMERIQSQNAIAEAGERFQQILDQSEDEKRELQMDILRLTAEMQGVSNNLDEQLRINDVNHWYHLYQGDGFTSNDELKAAVERLEEINSAGLPPDIVQRRDTVLEVAYPRLGANYFETGLADFRNNDSYMALVNLEHAHRFLNEESTHWNRLLFMISTLYLQEERFDEASEALFELVERAAPGYSGFSGAERTSISGMLSDLEARQ